ncbi:MAG: lamin tail domain-containing protein, partial [Sedimentisphaerales bacterium]|nr:lamin tail domain-containing protein [Sedimentisphaerales bacterium]
MPGYARITLFVLILAIFSIGPVKAQGSASLVINEFMASNSDSIRDPQGQYDDWIEIHNFGSSPVNVGGMYLTDDLSFPTKWQIPNNNPALTVITQGQYLLIWADNDIGDAGLHASFKLDANGEEIGLFDKDGLTLIDSVIYSGQTADISYGRYPDAGEDWRFFTGPSPAARNEGGYIGEVADTKFSHNRGFYEEPFSVTIATETEGAVIYYTLDGSNPYDVSGRASGGMIYTAPVTINKTTCLRAVAVKPGWAPSNTDTHTYIFLDDVIAQPKYPPGFPTGGWGHAGPDYQMDPVVVDAYSSTIKDDLKSIPTLSLVMNRDDWFGDKGIYVNESQDGTERVVSMEYIDPNTGDNFQINCAISMQGGISNFGTSLDRWKADKLSMRPRFKTETDDGTPTGGPTKLNHRIFQDTSVESFDTLVLDARLGNTWPYGGGTTDHGTRPWIQGRSIYQPDVAQYTRDQYVADIQNALGGYSHHGRHIHLYLNGLYWGLYNLHERPDHRFAASYFGGDADDYDCIKHSRNTIVNGSNTTFNQMLNIAESGLASDQQYQLIQQYLDVDNFMNYLIPHYYVGDWDWGHKNYYATRNSADPNGLWRFHHWDGEHLMEDLYENSTGRDNAGGPTRLHNRLMQNAEYRLLFADHVHRHFFNNGALTPEGAAALYQIRLDDVDRAVVGESARWGDNQIDRFAHIRYMRDPHWLLERDWLLDVYFQQRTAIVLDQFKSRGWYPRIDAPVFRVNGSYQHGGPISQNDALLMTAAEGAIWYTLDGTDPRFAKQSAGSSTTTTLVAESAHKRVLVPSSEIDDNWRSNVGFNDAAWMQSVGSPGGIGYERSSGYDQLFSLDLEEQMYAGNTTCYIRIVFVLNGSPDEFNFMTLKIKYDDAFIAYLNGNEVARRNFDGTPEWNSRASASHSDSAAVMFESIDASTFLENLHQGANLLAIHGLNASATSTDFLISAELIADKGGSSGVEGVSPTAVEYTGPINLPHSVQVKARVLSDDTWSALNEAVYAEGHVAENLRITEIMYNPIEPNEEFIELVNIGAETINLNLVSFTNGIDFTFPNIELAADEHIVVVGDQNIFKARYGTNIKIAGQYSGRLNNAGERIELVDAIGRTILDFGYKDGWYSLTDGEDFSLTIIDPASSDLSSWDEKDSWRPSAYAGGSPGYDDSGIVPNPGAIVINEVLAHSHAEASDWIELYNTTGTTIDIGGWFISDGNDNLFKYEIADGTTISPNGYLVLYEDLNFGNANDPGAIEPFALSENGERLYLSSAQDGVLTGYRNVEDFGASETGVSFGRYYKSGTGNYNFVAMEENTPGSANSYPKVGPIVISEIMYNPDWPDGGSYTNDQYEYIELKNISAGPVKLYRDDKTEPWKFTDGIEFIFPVNSPVTIPADGVILVVKHPAAFSWRYPNVPAGIIYGPYDGNLNNAGESLELSMPGDVDNEGVCQYIRIDRVNYSDGSHPEDCPGNIDLWPVEAD